MFNIKYKWLFSIVLACFTVFGAVIFDINSAAKAGENIAAKKNLAVEAPVAVQEPSACETVNYIAVKPLDIVAKPTQYLNKNIVMDAVFDKFSTLGLDYKPALRENAKYIGFLIQRDDTTDHDVPLSEMKIFLKREYAEKFVDLETGDKIQIKGRVFSAALGDPWIDADELTVTQKAKVKEEPVKK